MQVRRLVNNDYSFGNNKADFAYDLEACLQSCKTKLSQLKGEWFLDYRDGTAWGDVLGHTINEAEVAAVVRNTLAKVTGVKNVSAVDVSIDDRYAYIIAKIETDFGQARINQSLNILEILANDKANK